MLMVTTTVRMLDWILGDTTNLWPAVTLHAELVVGSAGLEHWLVNSTTASDQTEASAVLAVEKLLDTRRKLDSSSASIGVVSYNSAVSAGGLGNPATVTGFFFETAHDGTFWHVANWHDVTNIQLSLLTAVDKLTGAYAFRADHSFGDFTVLVGVLELDLGERRSTARVVHDVLDETLDEALSLGKVERTQLGSALSAFAARREDRAGTLTLALNDASHVCGVSHDVCVKCVNFCKFDLSL